MESSGVVAGKSTNRDGTGTHEEVGGIHQKQSRGRVIWWAGWEGGGVFRVGNWCTE